MDSTTYRPDRTHRTSKIRLTLRSACAAAVLATAALAPAGALTAPNSSHTAIKFGATSSQALTRPTLSTIFVSL
jgi:hypothetical protein